MSRPAVGLTALVTVTLAVTGAPPSPARAQDDANGTDLSLTGQTFAVEAGEPWHVELAIEGALAELVAPTPTTTTTTTALPVPGETTPLTPAEVAPTVELRFIAGRPVATRLDLAEALDGAPTVVADTFVQPFTPTSARGATTLAVVVPTATDPATTNALVLRRRGLYPITIQVLVNGDVVADHLTFVERLPIEPDPAAPMNVAIVAATPDPGPNPTAEEVAEGRRDLAAIAETAATVDGPISLSLPPVLLDVLADDEGLVETLRSSLVGDEVLAAPADVLDPSSAVAIDAQGAFTRELVEGVEILSAALPNNPPQRSAWLTPAEISTGGATMLRNLGFRPLVFTPEIYNALEGSIGGFLDTTLAVEVDLGDGPRFTAMVLDATGALLEPAAVTADTSATDAAVQIMATLVTTRRELGDGQRRSAVLVAPDTGIPDPDIAAALATFVAGMPDFAMAPLSVLASTTDTMIVGDDGPQVVTLPATAGPDLTQRARRIDLTRVSAESSGSMMLDDTQLLQWREDLDTLLSTAVSDPEVDATLERISAEAAAVRAQVEVPRRFTFTLTGRSSPLRLNLRNTATEPLRVLVTPRSAKLTFPSGDQLVELAPDGVTEVVIPVEARSNGTSSLEVAVLTPVFEQELGDPIVLTARVNALTGLGQVVTGAAILVLLSWWYGHFRRRRRARLARISEVDALSGQGSGVGPVSPDAAEATVAPPVEEPAIESLVDP